MLAYQPYRAPHMIHNPAPPKTTLSGPAMGQLAGIGAVPSLTGIALGAGTAWVGWTVGREKKGFLMVAGYVVAVLGALGALGGAAGLIGSLGK